MCVQCVYISVHLSVRACALASCDPGCLSEAMGSPLSPVFPVGGGGQPCPRLGEERPVTRMVGAGQAACWPAGFWVRLAAPEWIAGLHDGLLGGRRHCWVAAPGTRWLFPQVAGGPQPVGSPSPRAHPAAAPARLPLGPDSFTSWQPKSRPGAHPVPRGCPASHAQDCSPGPAAPCLHGQGTRFPSHLAAPPSILTGPA